jgi:flagellar biosynthesis protein FlhF
MQVKKFEAPTMQEALKVIKRELGPEAIILSTKHIKGGFGLMSKASVEVTAAIAEKDLKKKQMAEKGLPQNVKEKIWNSKAEKQSEIYNDYFEKQLKRSSQDKVEISAARSRQEAEDLGPLTPKRAITTKHAPVRQEAVAPARETQVAQAPKERRYIDIEDEAPAPRSFFGGSRAPEVRNSGFGPNAKHGGFGGEDEIFPSGSMPQGDTKVKSLERDIEQLKSMIGELSSTASSAMTAREEGDQDLTSELIRSMHDLVASGIEKKYARQIVRQAAFDLPSLDRHDEAAIMDKVAYHLVNDIQVKDLLEGVGARAGAATSTVIALVGPTGVGKTTTIAKIASLGILEKRLRVGLINLDSYKVAAAEQLSTYARIMNVPFRSVNTKEELQQAIYDFASLDLVLIDTTGRSQKDQESLLQLRHMLASIDNCQSVLLVSATTKDSDMSEVVSRFKLFQPRGLVFSKLDETSVYGCIYNVQKRSGLPLLYFTVGQRVPEDIEKASAERVADLVLDV